MKEFTFCYVLLIFSVIFSSWIIILNKKKGITITNTLQKILDDSNRKPTKI